MYKPADFKKPKEKPGLRKAVVIRIRDKDGEEIAWAKGPAEQEEEVLVEARTYLWRHRGNKHAEGDREAALGTYTEHYEYFYWSAPGLTIGSGNTGDAIPEE